MAELTHSLTLRPLLHLTRGSGTEKRVSPHLVVVVVMQKPLVMGFCPAKQVTTTTPPFPLGE